MNILILNYQENMVHMTLLLNGKIFSETIEDVNLGKSELMKTVGNSNEAILVLAYMDGDVEPNLCGWNK